MSEPLYLDYPSAKATVEEMKKNIENMSSYIPIIKKSMTETLHEYWRGDGYQKRKQEFESDYQPPMDKMLKAANEFSGVLDKCMAELKNLDSQLAGG